MGLFGAHVTDASALCVVRDDFDLRTHFREYFRLSGLQHHFRSCPPRFAGFAQWNHVTNVSDLFLLSGGWNEHFS